MRHVIGALVTAKYIAVAGALFGFKRIGRTQMFAYASIKGSALRNMEDTNHCVD